MSAKTFTLRTQERHTTDTSGKSVQKGIETFINRRDEKFLPKMKTSRIIYPQPRGPNLVRRYRKLKRKDKISC